MDETGHHTPPRYSEARRALQELSDLLYTSRPRAYQSVLNLTNVLIDKDRRFVLYLGAGCSATVRRKAAVGARSARVKSWRGLLDELFGEVLDEEDFLRELARRAGWGALAGEPPEFSKFYDEFDKQQLAWFLTQRLGGWKKRDEHIARLIEPEKGVDYDSDLYDAIFELPFIDIVTTNYDSHIVRFLEKKGRKFVEIADAESIATASKGEGCSRIFYLHGRVGADAPLVLDKFDYAKLLTERDGMLDYVTFLLRDSHVLYVGFGLDDLTFNQMETRLQTLHGENRPLSFACIPEVTAAEREWWGQRNLEIIDYDKRTRHEILPAIISYVNRIRAFVNWAESGRGKVGPNDDRISNYWPEVLRLYVKGDFEDGLVECRKALASTLFWKPDHGGRAGGRPLPFGKAAELCEVRIRMARFHYKLRWTGKNLSVHDEPMNENIKDAESLLGDLKVHLRNSPSLNPNDQRVVRALDNSLKIINARTAYVTGEFERARDLYAEVIESIKPDEIAISPEESKLAVIDKSTVIAKLRLAEGYYYARCQMSRLEYQFIDRGAEGRPQGRGEQISAMLKVEEEVGRICSFLNSREETCGEYSEWGYYYNSLWTLRRVSKWTAGRHAARVCKDLIPTAEERTDKAYEGLSEALENLTYEEASTLWPLSARWPALRYRYQCRAYALRWLVGQHLRKPGFDEDILKAFRAINEGFGQSEGPGLERERVINRLEAARLNIIAMFGEKLRQRGRGPIMDASPLTISAGLHYLDDAFVAIRNIPEKGPDGWLLALGYRLASYLYLVAGDDLVAVAGEIRSAELKPFAAGSADAVAATTEKQYRLFAEALHNPEAFDKRIQYFNSTFASIKKELAASRV